MNENVIPVKTGIQKGLSLRIVLRIAQFRLNLFLQFHRLTTAMERSVTTAGDNELCPAFFTDISLSNLVCHLCLHPLWKTQGSLEIQAIRNFTDH